MKAVREIEGERRHHDNAQDVQGLIHRHIVLGHGLGNPPLDGVPAASLTQNSLLECLLFSNRAAVRVMPKHARAR
jgi:hypothetical protein